MNVKKRVVSLLLALLLLASVFPTASAVNVTVTSAVNMRIGPDNASEIVCVIPKNAVAEKLDTFGNWYEVRYQGKTGYVYKTYLTESQIDLPKTVYITASSLNVRAEPNTTSAKIASLKKGDAVQVISLDNGWYTIKLNGKIGYISAEYTSGTAPIAEKTIYMNADTVTVYAAPKTNAKTLGTLKKGASATYTALIDGWYTIQYNGTAGFIQSKYTTKTKPNTPSTPSTSTGFTDVPAGKFYTDAVAWAVKYGVTSGTSATTFSPNKPCTRAEIVTFIWRAVGSPVMSGNNPFTDVSPSNYYYNAVLWAVQAGVTSGTTATTFSPNKQCTRGEVVTFLWSEAGKPSTINSIAFRDVSSNAFYYRAIKWAVKTGITSGTSAATFSPENVCTRAEVVTFLYKYMN